MRGTFLPVLLSFLVLMAGYGCSERETLFPKASISVKRVEPYLYYPGTEKPFAEASILLKNDLGIPAKIRRLSIKYSNIQNREKPVKVKEISTSFDQDVLPLAETTIKLTPIEPDFFDQLAFNEPVISNSTARDSLKFSMPDLFSDTASEEPPIAPPASEPPADSASNSAGSSTFPLTAQTFPVMGCVTLSLLDSNGHSFNIDAHMLIYYLGEKPIVTPTSTGTSTSTGTNTGTGTGTGTETETAYLKILSGAGTYKPGQFINFLATHSANVSGVKWESDIDKEFASKAEANVSTLSIGTHKITCFGFYSKGKVMDEIKVIVKK